MFGKLLVPEEISGARGPLRSRLSVVKFKLKTSALPLMP